MSSVINQNRWTPAKNYNFLVDTFEEAVNGYMKYLHAKKRYGENSEITRRINQKRIKGCGLEGASRTSKTWDTCMFLQQLILSYNDLVIGICRDYHSSFQDTTFATFKAVWQQGGLPANTFGKRVTTINYNRNFVKWLGVNDNISKTFGFETDILYGNEFLLTNQETRNQLEQRCKIFFIYDYNPNKVVDELYDYEYREDYRLFKTTIFDNPYAPANSVSKIVSYAHPEDDGYSQAQKVGYSREEWNKVLERNLKNKTANLYMWRVFGLGLRAAGEDLIFNDWSQYDKEPKTYEWKLYGCDFGYKVDETAIVEVKKSGHVIWVKEHLYKTGMLNKDIAQFLKEKGLTDQPIVCDTSPAQNIDELRAEGIMATSAKKFAGSLAWGVNSVQQYIINIHRESTNLKNEMYSYKYAKNKSGDFKRNTLGQRIPEDGFDHAIQSMIYAATYFLRVPEQKELKAN